MRARERMREGGRERDILRRERARARERKRA
eukprot:COSAG03_NODE_15525_length_428_cov_1.085106_1_plen_30_part_01